MSQSLDRRIEALEAKAPRMGLRVVTLFEPLSMPAAERATYCAEQRAR
jgi:hypothetical protein